MPSVSIALWISLAAELNAPIKKGKESLSY
jgi:hypothetical protein